MDETNLKPGVVEEVVDNSGGVEETDALMADVIAEVESEWQDEDLEALPDGNGDEVLEQPESDEEAAGGSEEESAEPAGEDDDRSIQRLVAREVELRQKEDALKVREEKLASVEQENQQLRQAVEELSGRVPQDFMEELRGSPRKTLEAAGYDPDHIVRVILAEKLIAQGKEVPKELRDQIREAEYDYKFKKQEKTLQQIEQQRRAAEFVAKTESEARQYVKAMGELKPEFSKDAPTVAKVAKANPERVYAEIMDEIGRDANARRREPNAQLISFAEAARRVEKRWGEFRTLLGAETPKDEASTNADKTLARGQQTGASTQTKKPGKPLTPAKPKTQEELEKEGLAEALAEYKRVEMAKRKGAAPLRR